jgi:hypothetical protein
VLVVPFSHLHFRFSFALNTVRIRQASHEHTHARPWGYGYVIEPERIVRQFIRGTATAATQSILWRTGAASILRGSAAGHDGILLLADDASGTTADLRGWASADIAASDPVRTTPSCSSSGFRATSVWRWWCASSAGNGSALLRSVWCTTILSWILLIGDRVACSPVFRVL